MLFGKSLWEVVHCGNNCFAEVPNSQERSLLPIFIVEYEHKVEQAALAQAG